MHTRTNTAKLRVRRNRTGEGNDAAPFCARLTSPGRTNKSINCFVRGVPILPTRHVMHDLRRHIVTNRVVFVAFVLCETTISTNPCNVVVVFPACGALEWVQIGRIHQFFSVIIVPRMVAQVVIIHKMSHLWLYLVAPQIESQDELVV